MLNTVANGIIWIESTVGFFTYSLHSEVTPRNGAVGTGTGFVEEGGSEL